MSRVTHVDAEVVQYPAMLGIRVAVRGRRRFANVSLSLKHPDHS